MPAGAGRVESAAVPRAAVESEARAEEDPPPPQETRKRANTRQNPTVFSFQPSSMMIAGV